MTSCETIAGLKLDERSRRAIKELKRKKEVSNILPLVLSSGVLANIFTKSSVPTAAINITQTDWSLYELSMRGMPDFARAVIQKEVELMIIHYQMYYDYKHLQFWKGVASGCQ